jgi:thiamine phosphate synthase YjbQ (UPF0047 family)
MKSHTEYLTFTVPARVGFVNIMPQVGEAVRKSGAQEGLVLCNAMHITASVFLNDDERGLHADSEKWLEALGPGRFPAAACRRRRSAPAGCRDRRRGGETLTGPS